MNKFIVYILLFVLSLFLFVIFNRVPVIDSVIFGLFFFGSFHLVFSLEKKVKPSKAKKLMQQPKVHRYVRERLNPYGYLMAGSIVFISTLFYIFSFYLYWRSALSILFVWTVMIILTQLIISYTSKKLLIWSITDYLEQFSEIKIEIIEQIISYFVAKKLENRPKMVKYIVKNYEIDQADAEKLVKKYDQYLEEAFGVENELISDEIAELNKK